jgi:hypothetical protein
MVRGGIDGGPLDLRQHVGEVFIVNPIWLSPSTFITGPRRAAKREQERRAGVAVDAQPPQRELERRADSRPVWARSVRRPMLHFA